MVRGFTSVIVFCGIALAVATAWVSLRPNVLSDEEFKSHYLAPADPPSKGLSLYHLGHSLVGRDMPAMLSALGGHEFAYQLGWGASLKGHWTREVPGFAEENIGDHFKPAHSAAESGDFDVLILTEMVEIKDAIKYFDSPEYLSLWVKKARSARPDIRVYLYETWHRLDDPQGWDDRLENDLAVFWEGELLRRAMAKEGVGTIYVIPGGQVMLAAVMAIEAGKIPHLTSRVELFSSDSSGNVDPIHFNHIGAWLMAMTHYAVIYQQSPLGLPSALPDANGKMMTPLPRETALALQTIVWDVVTGYALTGIPKD